MPDSKLDVTCLPPDQQSDLRRNIIGRIPLHIGRGGIFIFTVTSDQIKSIVEQELRQHFPELAWYTVDPKDREANGPLAKIRALLKGMAIRKGHLIQTEKMDPARTIFTLDIRKLGLRDAGKVLYALNIQREFVPDNHILFFLWCAPEHTPRFITDWAKDFWSFRTNFSQFGDIDPTAGQ